MSHEEETSLPHAHVFRSFSHGEFQPSMIVFCILAGVLSVF